MWTWNVMYSAPRCWNKFSDRLKLWYHIISGTYCFPQLVCTSVLCENFPLITSFTWKDNISYQYKTAVSPTLFYPSLKLGSVTVLWQRSPSTYHPVYINTTCRLQSLNLYINRTSVFKLLALVLHIWMSFPPSLKTRPDSENPSLALIYKKIRIYSSVLTLI